MEEGSIHSNRSITLKNNDIVLLRPYNDSIDRAAITEICKNVYSGHDYIPSMLSTYHRDTQSHPFVMTAKLYEGAEVVSFINFRTVPDESKMDKNRFYVYVEGLRVASHARGKGIATAMITSVLDLVRKGLLFQLPQLDAVKNQVTFKSITEPSNKAMESIFQKANWTPSPLFHLWPSVYTIASHKSISPMKWKESDRSKVLTSDETKQMLGKFNILQSAIPEHSAKISEQWYEIKGHSEILSSMTLLEKQGTTPFYPFFFSAETREEVGQFLEKDIAKEECRSVWRLDCESDKNKIRGLIFVRPHAIDQHPNCWDFIISASVVDVHAAESCILFAIHRLQFPWFYIGFDAPISREVMLQSPILSCVDVDPFHLYEH